MYLCIYNCTPIDKFDLLQAHLLIYTPTVCMYICLHNKQTTEHSYIHIGIKNKPVWFETSTVLLFQTVQFKIVGLVHTHDYPSFSYKLQIETIEQTSVT